MLKQLACVTLLGCVVCCAAQAVQAQPQAPKVLTVARQGQFDSLDPVKQNDIESSKLVSMVYSSLLTYAYLERPYTLVPDLLERMPTLSADKLTYTFTLRRGVRFHDNPCFPGSRGREVNTADVLYSLKRYADARLNTKSWFAMEGSVLGLDDYRAATAAGADREKLEITAFKRLDSHSFSIRLTHPNPLFLTALSYASAAIVPVEAVQFYKDRFDLNPVGTGPYTLKDAQRKGVLRFVKNRDYFGVYPSTGEPGDAAKGLLKDAGKKLPLVDVVEMPLIEEAQPAALKFLKGELDWRTLDRASYSKLVARGTSGSLRLAAEFAGRFDLYTALAQDMSYIGFNMRDPLLGRNKLLRQAMAHLVDTQGEIDLLRNGRGHKLQSIVSVIVPGNERDTGAHFRNHDPVAARALLAQAGYPGGKGLPPLTLAYPSSDAEAHTTFDFHKARFAAAGVQLKGVFMDGPAFIKAVEGGNFQLIAYGWAGDPDAADFYQQLFSRNIGQGSNLTAFSDPAYDRAFEAAHYLPNGPERYRYFRQMNDILRDEVPMIFAVNSLRVDVAQKWVSNFKRHMLVPEAPFVDVDMVHKIKGP